MLVFSLVLGLGRPLIELVVSLLEALGIVAKVEFVDVNEIPTTRVESCFEVDSE